MDFAAIGRLRFGTGLLACLLMAASGLLHSAMGWPAVKRALSGADATTVAGLAVPWHFAGGAMMAFAALAAYCLVGAVQANTSLLVPVRFIAIAYLLFGLVGLVLIKPDPTFLMFLIPGAMLLFASR